MNWNKERNRLYVMSPEKIADNPELIALLDMVLDRKLPSGFGNVPDYRGRSIKKNPVLFSSLPEHMRPTARRELDRLIRKCEQRGQKVSRFKYASLVANAAWITKDIIFSRKKFDQAKRHWRLKTKRERVRKILAARAFANRNIAKVGSTLGGL